MDNRCFTCLSEDRKLRKLFYLKEAYDLILSTNTKEKAIYNSVSIEPMICFECAAKFCSFIRFRSVVFKAHKIIYEHGNYLKESGRNIKSLSNLSTTTNVLYDRIFNYRSTNFKPIEIVVKCEKSNDIEGFEDVGVDDSLKNKKKKHRKSIAKKEKSGEDLFCGVCNEKFDSKYKKTCHEKSAHSDPLLCDECGKKFKLKSNLRKHMLVHMGRRDRQPCSVCGKSFPGRAAIKSHMRHAHCSAQPYRCDMCDVGFKTETKLRSHLKWSKKHGGVGTERHECDRCQKKFHTKGRLAEHFSYKHNGVNLYSCHICSKGMSSMVGLQKHIKSIHEGREQLRSHVCETCGDSFKRKFLLNQHRYIHTGEKPYACAVCAAKFRQKSCLYVHNRRLHLKITK